MIDKQIQKENAKLNNENKKELKSLICSIN